MSEEHDKKVLDELVFIRYLLLFMAAVVGLIGFVLATAILAR
jgi:hypothetical protein